MNSHLVGNTNIRIDISETLSYLKEEGFYAEHFRMSQQFTGKKNAQKV